MECLEAVQGAWLVVVVAVVVAVAVVAAVVAAAIPFSLDVTFIIFTKFVALSVMLVV